LRDGDEAGLKPLTYELKVRRHNNSITTPLSAKHTYNYNNTNICERGHSYAGVLGANKSPKKIHQKIT